MYSGLSRKKSTARPNISVGPMIQFCTSESASTRLLRRTFPSSSYRTFASGGNIMSTSPTAIGTDVLPTLMRPSAAGIAGTAKPRPTPSAIAPKIHSVR
jgi:hypothetical protein